MLNLHVVDTTQFQHAVHTIITRAGSEWERGREECNQQFKDECNQQASDACEDTQISKQRFDAVQFSIKSEKCDSNLTESLSINSAAMIGEKGGHKSFEDHRSFAQNKLFKSVNRKKNNARQINEQSVVKRSVTDQKEIRNVNLPSNIYYSPLAASQPIQPVYNGYTVNTTQNVLNGRHFVSQPMVVCLPPSLANQTSSSHILANQQRTFQIPADQSSFHHVLSSMPVYRLQAPYVTGTSQQTNYNYVLQTSFNGQQVNAQQREQVQIISNAEMNLNSEINKAHNTNVNLSSSSQRHRQNANKVDVKTGIAEAEKAFDPVSRAVFHIALNQVGDKRRIDDSSEQNYFASDGNKAQSGGRYLSTANANYYAKRFKLTG